MKRRNTLAAGVLLAALAISTQAAAAERSYRAELTRTAYGAPHVKAADYGSLGYGAGYAAAQDNFCDFAERTLTVSGQRARYFGPGDKDANVVSDLYHQRLIQTGRLDALLAGDVPGGFKPSADARALAKGFIAGINRYVRDTGAASLPDARCRGAAWIRSYDETDYWRATLAGQQPTLMTGVAAAAPPGVADIVAPHGPAERSPVPEGQGSNAYALGREVTKTGHGVLLGNPHYPWDGINRFTRMHFIVSKIAKRLADRHSRRKKKRVRGQLDFRKTLRKNAAYDSLGRKGWIMSHLSHSYHSGACLYFTFAFVFGDDPIGEYDTETKIGGIDFLPKSKTPKEAQSLSALPAVVDKTFPPAK